MIRPLILGRGMAGRALQTALAMYPDEVRPARWLEREKPLPAPRDAARDLVVLANPHALHAPRLLEAAERGYRYAICEKPAAVDSEQIGQLQDLPLEVWICHGYRLLWGPSELKRAWEAGRFGTVMSIEGRYWQSSAVRDRGKSSWKNDPALAGKHDVLLDLATHWADLAIHLAGRLPESTRVRRWYANAAAPHRDTHLHLAMDFGEIASFASISKTAHGEGNTLVLDILGEHAAARWSFAEPDLILWGNRGVHSTQARTGAEPPARPAPFHGLGWMEGYGRLVGEVIGRIAYARPADAPTLAEHLEVVRCLLTAAASEG